jgi:putative methyltransferase
MHASEAMDVYKQAADVVRKIRAGKGTAKALCLAKEMQKKKQTYAVVCETLRRYNTINAVLDAVEFFQYYPSVERDLAIVLSYDICFGRGIKTKQHEAAVAVTESAELLREALPKVQAEQPDLDIEMRNTHFGDDALVDEEGKTLRMPTYVRVNTLKGLTVEDAHASLRKRSRDDDAFVNEEGQGRATLDAHVPQLLVMPPKSDLHKHKWLRNGQIVIQDKASCIPPCVVLGAVPVVRDESLKGTPYVAPRTIIDGCAAPGNKTTQIAALGASMNIPDLSVLGVEKDEKRFGILKNRVRELGADGIVETQMGDFSDIDGAMDGAPTIEAVMLDPSCSASGMVARVDIASAADTSAEKKDQRVEALARMQTRLLTHAMAHFPAARRIVYSTCSVHQRENEDVCRAVLEDERLAYEQWTLSAIMPDTWATRGQRIDGCDLPLERTLRCDPRVDRTNGFFVACFDRVPPAVRPREEWQVMLRSEELALKKAAKEAAAAEEEAAAKAAAKKGNKVALGSSDDDNDDGAAKPAAKKVAAEPGVRAEVTAAKAALGNYDTTDDDDDSDDKPAPKKKVAAEPAVRSEVVAAKAALGNYDTSDDDE